MALVKGIGWTPAFFPFVCWVFFKCDLSQQQKKPQQNKPHKTSICKIKNNRDPRQNETFVLQSHRTAEVLPAGGKNSSEVFSQPQASILAFEYEPI